MCSPWRARQCLALVGTAGDEGTSVSSLARFKSQRPPYCCWSISALILANGPPVGMVCSCVMFGIFWGATGSEGGDQMSSCHLVSAGGSRWEVGGGLAVYHSRRLRDAESHPSANNKDSSLVTCRAVGVQEDKDGTRKRQGAWEPSQGSREKAQARRWLTAKELHTCRLVFLEPIFFLKGSPLWPAFVGFFWRG